MQSPWSSGRQSYPHGDGMEQTGYDEPVQPSGQATRRPLDQYLVERSTSEPPPTSDVFTKNSNPYDDALVGSDLLEHMSGLYVGGDERPGSGAGHEISAMLGSGFSPEPVPRPVSASGSGTSGDTNEQLFGVGPENLVRSKSAAPTLHGRAAIGPPPGLNLTSSQSDSYASIPVGRRRSSSAGVLGSQQHAALRPSAKTLMDLIHEDANPEDGYGDGVSNAVDRRVLTPDSRDPTPHGQQYRPQQRGHVLGAHQSQKQQDRLQFQMDDMAQARVQRGLSPQLERQNQMSPQYSLGPSPTSPVDQFRRQGTPSDQGSIYAQAQQTIIQQTQMVDPQQQIYYQQQPQQRPGAQQAGMQGAPVLQPGQAMLVSAAGAQQQYGYATIQYHTAQQRQTLQPQQTAQIIQSVPGSGEQYVSIVPVQGGTPQMTYWQPEVGAGGQPAMGQVTIVNAPGPGGAPIAVARVGAIPGGIDIHQQSNAYVGGAGRSRDKGGRGRRGGASRRSDGKNSGHSATSPLLEEFREMKNRDWTMHHILGHTVEFCQDQNGSRFIQQRLEMGDPAEQQIVVKEVLPAIRVLRNDVFGNYVVQKLFDFGTPDVKKKIRDTMQGEVLQLSLQMYGCRVVQKALESLDDEDFTPLMVEFHHNVLSCIHDQNGNHVIQKCIEVVSKRAKKALNAGDVEKADALTKQVDFIIRDVLVNTATLSCHPYGCRVLQRILEHCGEAKKVEVLDEIMTCHRKLLDDQYGNYVIQHVLQFGRHIDRDSILAIVVESGLLGLSRQKFASNVVEKLLKYGNSSQRRAILREMLKFGDDPALSSGDRETTVVLLMVRDAYANYVVQTTLDVVPESEEKRLLLEELNSHADELRQYTFAKHIVAKLGTMNKH